MQNNRLTKMNQYGDILYCGPRNTNSYHKMGLYAKDMDEEQIELVLSKLYDMEELIESLQDNLSKMSTTIHLLEKVYNANQC